MAVDRCVCWNLTFADLRYIAESDSLDFNGLVNRTGCCTGCTTCEPYVRRMLKTGETDMPVLSAAEVREAMDGA
jgi:bacterioferritin-associated ferredoxin